MKYKILNNASNFYKFSNIQCEQLDINNKLCNNNSIDFNILDDVSNYFKKKRNLRCTNNKKEFGTESNSIENFGENSNISSSEENSNISSSEEKSTETDYINIYIYATFAIIILFLIGLLMIELFNKNISLNLFKNKK